MSYKGVFRTALATPGLLKLDKVGPVDNRPSTDYLHHFINKKITKKKKKKNIKNFINKLFWHVTGDTWHVTGDTWQMTHDMWHMTRDTLHMKHDT